ncbi:MFS transporter [Paenibacillus sp. PCH8]|uniref:MFS transporter n=1 Tax=Paenibacillus sp. PCH8 TaxID=2066524 RepID=UPI000CF8BFCE|nr:MFS transporter [Paenibacillus sp. PCH8]PQP81382.1 MFS transporter [Paenibacillus sp. PCH8]
MTRRNHLLIFILATGVFGIINTEMGVIGILPALADHFDVSVSKAGLLVSLFALCVAIAGPTMPLLFSGVDRKKAMLLVLGVFIISNMVSIYTSNFTLALITRVIPAFFHPIYCSLAFTIAASTVSREEAPRAVSNVMIGVSAGMVIGVPIVSFLAEYLTSVTNVSLNMISMMLLIYGGANIIGNIVAGRLLTNHAIKSVVIFPFALGIVYIFLFWFGQFTIPMIIITFVWGIFGGLGANINQYWMMTSAPEASDFTNGLFLTSANLGTTLGASLAGLLILTMGTPYMVIAGMISLVLGAVCIGLRNNMNKTIT